MTRTRNVADIIKQPFTTTLGTSNYRAGVNAGNSIASGGNFNTVVGDEAGTAINTGDYNTAFGFQAGDAINTSSYNTAVGAKSATAIAAGQRNSAFGYGALQTDTVGGRAVALGFNALGTQNFTSATDNYNIGVGYDAGGAITTGVQNTLIGSFAGDSLTDADYNLAVGQGAVGSDTLGSRSTGLGYGALANQNFTSATDTGNTAVGYEAGLSVTTGTNNTLIGGLAGDAITDGNTNVAVGSSSLSANQRGDRNTAAGYKALEVMNPSGDVDTYNTAFGFSAGRAITTGTSNTFVGGEAGDGTDDGVNNVAVGKSALSANCGDNNTAVGEAALAVATGANNQCFGNGAGSAITSGNYNTILGQYTGNQGGLDIRTSSNNLVLADGQGNPRVHVLSSGNMFVGRAQESTWQEGFGVESVGSGSAGTYLITAHKSGVASGRPYQYFFLNNAVIGAIIQSGTNGVAYNTSSDYRLKENVVYDWDATTRLKQLKPARFNFIADGTDVTQDGFMAHEAQEVVPIAVSGTKDAMKDEDYEITSAVLDDDGVEITAAVMGTRRAIDGQGIDHSLLVPLLVKTIQELEARITILESGE